MSKIKGTNIAAPIVPYATNDNYPTHYAKYGKGGYVSVSSIEERDSIPEGRLEEGMLVFVLENEQSYQYLNGNWVAAKVGKEDSLKFEGSKDYNARVENGIVIAYNELPTFRLPMPMVKGVYSCIKLNSFYLGYATNNSPHNFLPCSHRFIELSNISSHRMSLDGLFIKIYYGGSWETLRLSGIIEPESTYLIRGEQTSVIDADTTKLKIRQYNQSWDSSRVNATSGIMLYLCWGNEDGQILNENNEFVDYPSIKEDILDSYSYVDCVSSSDTTITGNGIQRNKNANARLENIVFVRKCPLDPCYVDTKDNKIDWRYHFIHDSRYQPGASYEGKNLSWGNDWLGDGTKSITLTCTLGKIGASSDDIFNRNFTWTTLDKNIDTLFIRPVSRDGIVYSWSAIKGIFNQEGDPVRAIDDEIESSVIDGPFEINSSAFYIEQTGEPIPQGLFEYYNRSRWETFTGEVVYTYRVLLTITEPGIYEYCCGKYDGDPVQESMSDSKYIHTNNTGLVYIQTGNYNINTFDDAILLKQSSLAFLDTYGYNPKTTSLSSIGASFIANTGNIVKHGTRPEEWIYYIRNNKLLDYYAEFITPGENDLGEINFYDIGEKKLNFRMLDMFYTFEYNTDNIPTLDNFGANNSIMPGLYSTDYLGHVLISFNSTPITFPKDPDQESTTTSILGISDTLTELPGLNDNICDPSNYYKHELYWLFRELYYLWNRDRYYGDLPAWGEDISEDLLKLPAFVEEPLEGTELYLPDFVTILTNRSPIEPYTDDLYSHREEADLITTRSSDYNTTDNLNYHLNFLASRYFKLWQIKAVLGNCNWGISGLTRKIHDAGIDYAPPVINTEFKDILIDGTFEAYDTFQPVIIEENINSATDLVKSQEVRYIWNGSGNTWSIEFDGGGYTNIEPGDYRSYRRWDGRYSVFLVEELYNGNDRNNMLAPRYVILSSSLNQFELYNEANDTVYDKSSGNQIRFWFENNAYSSDSELNSPQGPNIVVHKFLYSREETENEDQFFKLGGRDIKFKGITLMSESRQKVDSYKDWNTEEEMYLLDIDDDPMEFNQFRTKATVDLLGPLNF